MSAPSPFARTQVLSPQPASPRPRRSAPGSSERVQARQKEPSAQVSDQRLKLFLSPLPRFPSFSQVGCILFPGTARWTFPQGALNLGTCHPNQFYRPADRMKVEPQVSQETDWGWGFEPTTCRSLVSQPFYLFWYFLVSQRQYRRSLPTYLWVLCFALLLHVCRKEPVLLL